MAEQSTSNLDDAVDIILGKSYEHYNYELKVEPIEYVIDGFQAVGLTIVAGQPGIGKTSLLVSLYFQVAGLGKPGDPLRPLIRRKVVYVSEDPRQVQQILVGMYTKCCTGVSDEEIREWFIIKRAQRLNPSDLPRVISQYQKQYSVESYDQFGSPYFIFPLIVLDTSNATLDLQNENDNSEVGRAIAEIKGAIGDRVPVVVVAHLSKTFNRSNIDDISPRGASAWSGDANAVQFVIKDEALEDERFLILGKRRFEASFTEIRFETRCYFEQVDTFYGAPQTVPIRYAEASKYSKTSRESSKHQANKRAAITRNLAMRQAIVDAVRDKQRDGVTCITRNSIARTVQFKKQTTLDTINQLLEDRVLVEDPLPPGVKPTSNATKTTISISVTDTRTYANRDEV